MWEVFTTGIAVFSIVIAVLYSKRILDANQRYREAKRAVDDIILSFNRQLKQLEERVDVVARKVGASSSRQKRFIGQLKNHEKELQMHAEKFKLLSTAEKALARLDSLENQVDEAISIKEAVLQKIENIEKQRSPRKERKPDIQAPIPIKREKALAPLNDTELMVLELLKTEGELTAPDVKERIELSREHTARLMKKLYENGYLERTANKIPFRYRLKQEMQKILGKSVEEA